jgi:hypothetical protein
VLHHGSSRRKKRECAVAFQERPELKATTLTEAQKDKLSQANSLIGDVQIELFTAQEKQKLKPGQETWRDLYWLRTKLIDFMHHGHVQTRNGDTEEYPRTQKRKT